jgi:cation transport ATPase
VSVPVKPAISTAKETYIAAATLIAIAAHLVLRYSTHLPPSIHLGPLFLALIVGGIPILWSLGKKFWQRELGSDLLAGISIVASVEMGEYLVGTIIVLMFSGGTALEQFATRRASSVLDALAKRMPQVAHRQRRTAVEDIKLDQIQIGDHIIVLPHEICPADGAVIEGHGVMDESYLTGEPFEISKTPGAKVLSGAINGDMALTIEAAR